MATRSYYAVVPPSRWAWLLSWLRPRRDYTGWVARATTDRDVPVGTEGLVVASVGEGGARRYVIDFRPHMELHAPLPWPGIELIEPGNSTVRSVP